MAWVERHRPTRGKQHWYGFVQSPLSLLIPRSPDEYLESTPVLTLLTVTALATSSLLLRGEEVYVFSPTGMPRREHGGFTGQPPGCTNTPVSMSKLKWWPADQRYAADGGRSEPDCTLGDNGGPLETWQARGACGNRRHRVPALADGVYHP